MLGEFRLLSKSISNFQTKFKSEIRNSNVKSKSIQKPKPKPNPNSNSKSIKYVYFANPISSPVLSVYNKPFPNIDFCLYTLTQSRTYNKISITKNENHSKRDKHASNITLTKNHKYHIVLSKI